MVPGAPGAFGAAGIPGIAGPEVIFAPHWGQLI